MRELRSPGGARRAVGCAWGCRASLSGRRRRRCWARNAAAAGRSA